MPSTFDYSSIPPGYYDRVMREGPAIQRAWQRQKFTRVREMLGPLNGDRILDVGCGAGSFLGLLSADHLAEMVGIDVSPEQTAWANEHYGTENRRFLAVSNDRWPLPDGHFDAAALIEVIEHLHESEIIALGRELGRVLRPGAALVVTTPNYASHWPVLECLVNRFSAVDYEEQHVTRFNPLTIRRRFGELLGEWFEFEYATTSHFIAPFLAVLSRRVADGVAKTLAPGHWRWPFGALLMVRLRRKGD